MLGHSKHLVDVLFRLAHKLVIDGGSIELHQRQPPLAGHGARAHAFAASLHAQNNDAAWWFQPRRPRRFFPGPLAPRQPALQIFQSADCSHAFLAIDEFQHAAAPQDLFLGLQDFLGYLRTKRITSNHGLGDGALGFFLGQPAHVSGDGLHVFRQRLALQRKLLAQASESFFRDLLQARVIRQRQLQILRQRFHLRRQWHRRAGDHHGAAPAGKILRRLAQPPGDDG